uniref:Uncharacterized protein n=1 Tax=Parascaris equorum TaxID=6256 RepID=A0A914S788_PAREQ
MELELLGHAAKDELEDIGLKIPFRGPQHLLELPLSMAPRLLDCFLADADRLTVVYARMIETLAVVHLQQCI